MFWGVETAGKVQKSSITPDQVKAIVENIQALNSAAFETDNSMFKKLISLDIPGKKPLGLISPSTTCLRCGSQLKLRKDRHAAVTIYDYKLGTIPGAHFHKICPNRTCSVTQYYGYHTLRAILCSTLTGNPFHTLLLLVTFFSVDFFDAHILIGQLSFKQQADIYNYMHKCPSFDTARYASV